MVLRGEDQLKLVKSGLTTPWLSIHSVIHPLASATIQGYEYNFGLPPGGHVLQMCLIYPGSCEHITSKGVI